MPLRLAFIFFAAWCGVASAQSLTERLAQLNPPGPVVVSARWSLLHTPAEEGTDDEPKSQSVVRIGFRRSADSPVSVDAGVLRADAPAARDKRLWRLMAKSAEREESVDFALRADEGAAGGLPAILLVPDKTPSTELTYWVEFRGDPTVAFLLAPGWRLTNPAALKRMELSKDDLEIDEAFINGNKALESKFELHAGEQAALSARLQFGLQSWNDGDPWRFQGFIEANGTYERDDSGRYVDSSVAEIDFLHANHYRFGEGAAKLIGISQLGAAVRFETDQGFDVVNGTIGATWWNSFNAEWLQDFGRAVCLTRNRTTPVPTPVLVFAYDYVFDVHDDLATGERLTEIGEHRLRGRFYWSLQLAHEWDIPVVSALAGTRYDVDLLIDVGGIYDFRSGSFEPDTRLSVEIAPSTLGDSKPSFTLTYVNGKTTPRFEDYDAFFAGLKLPF